VSAFRIQLAVGNSGTGALSVGVVISLPLRLIGITVGGVRVIRVGSISAGRIFGDDHAVEPQVGDKLCA